MSGRIEVEHGKNGVVTLWIDNPDHRNALNNSLIDALSEQILKASEDSECRAVVLRGRGGIFCAGRELRDLRAIVDADIATIKSTYHRLRLLNEAIYLCPRPTICVIEKYAFGAGATVASWCDISIAETNAKLAFPEVHHGIVPSPALMALIRGVPRKAVMELILTGRRINADEAQQINLITRAVAAENMSAEIDLILEGILNGSQQAIAATKEFIVHCEDASHRAAMLSAVDSISIGLANTETKRRINAFLDRT